MFDIHMLIRPGVRARCRGRTVMAAGLLLALGMAGCSPSSLVDVDTPNTVVDPSQIKTATGAIQLRSAAVAGIVDPLARGNGNNVLYYGGLLTDELTETQYTQRGFDERRMLDPSSDGYGGGVGLYIFIHRARVRMQIAREALALYAGNTSSAPSAWRGELFALEGYTVLWFAEYFCSGIPLTTVHITGSSEPSAGLTTQDLFTRAITLFDSAIVAGADSAQYVNLARVGKGRALLGLGQFAAADSAVRDVPTDFVYRVQFTTSGDYSNAMSDYGANGAFRAQDNEGHNGLVWSTDPRTAIYVDTAASHMLRPAKYNISPGGALDPFTSYPGTPVRLADGLEARLIQAEAALNGGDGSWLAQLNTLRHTCVGAAECAPVPGITTANLPDTLTDPGDPAARVDLLFKERAMWLYLTGHRQGDLRRLAHVYHRNATTLWPTGTIVSPAFPPAYTDPPAENGTLYGTDVVFGPDPQERTSNPRYGGCYDYNP